MALLRHKGQAVGAALRMRAGIKPVFVSPGRKMDLGASARIVLGLCRNYRTPEPLRQAHIFVNRLRMESAG